MDCKVQDSWGIQQTFLWKRIQVRWKCEKLGRPWKTQKTPFDENCRNTGLTRDLGTSSLSQRWMKILQKTYGLYVK